MLGPFATASRLTPIHQMSLAVLSHATCTSMSTTTTTTTTRDRGDRYGPMEWAQLHDRRIRVGVGVGRMEFKLIACSRLAIAAHARASCRRRVLRAARAPAVTVPVGRRSRSARTVRPPRPYINSTGDCCVDAGWQRFDFTV